MCVLNLECVFVSIRATTVFGGSAPSGIEAFQILKALCWKNKIFSLEELLTSNFLPADFLHLLPSSVLHFCHHGHSVVSSCMYSNYEALETS